MKDGYYWVKTKLEYPGLPGIFEIGKPTIGYYDTESVYGKLPGSSYPWQIVGSDEIFKEHEIIVISKEQIKRMK